MLTSELITKLQEIQRDHGNLPVAIGEREHQPADDVVHMTQDGKTWAWIWPEFDPKDYE